MLGGFPFDVTDCLKMLKKEIKIKQQKQTKNLLTWILISNHVSNECLMGYLFVSLIFFPHTKNRLGCYFVALSFLSILPEILQLFRLCCFSVLIEGHSLGSFSWVMGVMMCISEIRMSHQRIHNVEIVLICLGWVCCHVPSSIRLGWVFWHDQKSSFWFVINYPVFSVLVEYSDIVEYSIWSVRSGMLTLFECPVWSYPDHV